MKAVTSPRVYLTATFATLLMAFSSQQCYSADDASALALKAMNDKEYSKALELYRSVLNAEPTNSTALYNSGVCYLMRNDLDSAALLFERTVKADSRYARSYFNLGMIYVQQAKYQASVDNYTKYIELDSTIPQVFVNRMIGYISLGQYKNAYADGLHCKAMSLNEQLGAKVDLMLQMLGDRNPASKTKTFSDPKSILHCELPGSWYSKVNDDNKTLNFFVSAEKVEKETDLFSLGMTARLIRRISKSFSQLEGKDAYFITGFWNAVSEKGGAGLLGFDNYFYHKQLSQSQVTIDGLPFMKITRELQLKSDSYRITEIELTTSFNDSILSFTFEAPSDEFNAFQPMYERAIASLKVSRD